MRGASFRRGTEMAWLWPGWPGIRTRLTIRIGSAGSLARSTVRKRMPGWNVSSTWPSCTIKGIRAWQHLRERNSKPTEDRRILFEDYLREWLHHREPSGNSGLRGSTMRNLRADISHSCRISRAGRSWGAWQPTCAPGMRPTFRRVSGRSTGCARCCIRSCRRPWNRPTVPPCWTVILC